MARAHVMRPITASNGDLLYGATVTVNEAGLSVPVSQTLYAGPTGEDTLPNPFVATNGVVDFWLDVPQRVSVLVRRAGHSDILVYLDAAPPPEETARTDTPLVISGVQAPGAVLLAGETPGQAVWGTPPVSSGITPLVSVINESFSLSRDPASWNFIQAATTARSYTNEVPADTLLTRSLKAVHTGASGSLAVISPGFTLTEPGFISLWLRPELAAGEQVKVAVTSQIGTKTVLETISDTRPWGFYRYPVASGTYQSLSVEFTGAASFTGVGHQMWVTEIRAVYGGLVPAHSHAGVGTNSVLLGPGAAAAGNGAVAAGSASSASSTDSVAVGARAAASGVRGVAVGADALSPAENAVAVGSNARGSATATNWTAVGRNSYVDANNGSAFGSAAQVYGVDGVAVGRDAYVGPSATSSVAIGPAARAEGNTAIAIGNAAQATHNGSIAIGNGAQTTAALQVMLGNSVTPYKAVVVANKLYALQDANVGADAFCRVGFFGSEGTVRPTVTGSDGGNIALRNTIAALAGLGLVSNNTTP